MNDNVFDNDTAELPPYNSLSNSSDGSMTVRELTEQTLADMNDKFTAFLSRVEKDLNATIAARAATSSFTNRSYVRTQDVDEDDEPVKHSSRGNKRRAPTSPSEQRAKIDAWLKARKSEFIIRDVIRETKCDAEVISKALQEWVGTKVYYIGNPNQTTRLRGKFVVLDSWRRGNGGKRPAHERMATDGIKLSGRVVRERGVSSND